MRPEVIMDRGDGVMTATNLIAFTSGNPASPNELDREITSMHGDGYHRKLWQSFPSQQEPMRIALDAPSDFGPKSVLFVVDSGQGQVSPRLKAALELADSLRLGEVTIPRLRGTGDELAYITDQLYNIVMHEIGETIARFVHTGTRHLHRITVQFGGNDFAETTYVRNAYDLLLSELDTPRVPTNS